MLELEKLMDEDGDSILERWCQAECEEKGYDEDCDLCPIGKEEVWLSDFLDEAILHLKIVERDRIKEARKAND